MSKTSKGKKLVRVLVFLVIVAVLLGVFAWFAFFREEPQQLADDSIEEYFKYGSIGAENAQGIPYWIWVVLPKMFPEYLPAPGGYAALGFPWEQGRPMPIGFTKKTIGFDRVALNCALCHTASFRKEGEPVRHVVLGGPGNTQDILAYQRFLFACADDPRFNSRNIMNAIGQIVTLPGDEALLYRFLLIPGTRRALLKQKADFEWTDLRPDWGRGRIDPFNPVKVSLLGVDPGDTLGNSDMQPIWALRTRAEAEKAFHWDGLQNSVHEVLMSSALGDGATEKSLPTADLERLEEYLLDLPSPKLTDYFPDAVDSALAASGAPIFAEHCGECHAPDGERTATVLPLDDPIWQDELGDHRTDPHRAEMWTQESADAYNSQSYGDGLRFEHFRSTGGYASVNLDGLWLRAPYLHNGSVPYLGELLERPEDRTPRFWRGYDVYDPERMGFVSEGAEARRFGTRFDIRERGNSNQGHLWGTDLSAEEKLALLEFLKTL
jgi:mono/diheme cytochrome c family protein